MSDSLASQQTRDYQPAIAPGVVIADRYTLVEKIGEGGMGEVWVAKQTEPFKRRVALKLIKPGMDSRQVLARFEAERQALALMNHPYIAEVLDGGITTQGRPFFVMELVDGLSLTRFCDETLLPPRERLQLFIPICQAVQHAHQKGIVHRDLKPSNILVTLYDGKPVPKIIDFGVAKATGGKLSEESLSTQFGAILGTFEYMSPEQAGYSALDVDTRADIYSLGVILYELLTGLRPFEKGRLQRAALDELFRIIREEEPSRPSIRLSSSESLPSLAKQRKTDPGRLKALMRGELDWIVMKCLEKARERRYETANGLARDVERYLADEPIEARPPSAGYRMHKFLRRNRGKVLTGTLVLVVLLVGILGTVWGLVRAEQQRKVAEANEKHAQEERFRTQIALTEQIAQRIESNLRQLEGVGHGLASLASLAPYTKQQVQDLNSWMKSMVERDERIFGLTVAFDPGVFSNGEFCSYVSRKSQEGKTGVSQEYLGGSSYPYLKKAWYVVPKREKAAMWDQAELDTGAGDEVLIAYLVPIWRTRTEGSEKQVVGVVTVDVSIERFFHSDRQLSPTRLASQLGTTGGYGFMITHATSPSGEKEAVNQSPSIIIHHPNPDFDFAQRAKKRNRPRLLRSNNSTFNDRYSEFMNVTSTIMERSSGIAINVKDPWTDQFSTFLFAQVPSVRWTVVAVIQKEAVFPDLSPPFQTLPEPPKGTAPRAGKK